MVLPVTVALESARIKIKRANVHSGIARREARRFFTRHPDPTIEVEPEGEPDFSIGSTFAFKLVVSRGWPDLPESFAARFGDAIHNYRSALDHLAWQLTCHGTTPPDQLTVRERRRVQFPSYDTEKAFRENIHDRLPGVHDTTRDFIKSRHKYVRGHATNNALLSLYHLSNQDKHKTLVIIASAFVDVQHQVTFTHCRPVGFWNPEGRPAPKKGAVVATVECVVTNPNPNVTMKTQPRFHIALEDGRGFGDVLDDIRREVVDILEAPEINAAIS